MNDLRCYVEFTFCKLGGTALIEALGRSDLAAVEVLLDGVKDADTLTGLAVKHAVTLHSVTAIPFAIKRQLAGAPSLRCKGSLTACGTGGPFAVRLMNLLSIWTDDTFLRAVVLLHNTRHGPGAPRQGPSALRGRGMQSPTGQEAAGAGG